VTHVHIDSLQVAGGTEYKDLVMLWGLDPKSLTYSLEIVRCLDSEKIIQVTTNLEGHGYFTEDDCFFIKNYSESKGLGDALVKLGLVERTKRETVYFGPFDASADEYQLTDKCKKAMDL